MLYFAKASPFSIAVGDVLEVWLLFQKKKKGTKQLNFVCTIIGFKEVYFVVGGVDFFKYVYAVLFTQFLYFTTVTLIGNHIEKRR